MSSSVIYPGYTVHREEGSDRLRYESERPWPNPGRKHLRINFSENVQVVNFDEWGRPSDVGHEITMQARQKIRSRRQTPRGNGLPEEL